MKELSTEDLRSDDVELAREIITGLFHNVGPAAILGVLEDCIAVERGDLYILMLYAERISVLVDEMEQAA